MAFVLIVIFLVGIIIALVYQNQARPPLNAREQLFIDRFAQWLTYQVALQCDIKATDIDQRARNRIYGAARKAAKALAEHGDVQIQLPNIIESKNQKPKSFKMSVTMNEISHLRKD